VKRHHAPFVTLKRTQFGHNQRGLTPLARLSRTVFAFACVCIAAPRLRGDFFFTGLGDLPGGVEGSAGNGLSADGMVVVGVANEAFQKSAAGIEAFRWTRDGGMIGLGLLPGGDFSGAFGVSPDGVVVVGRSGSSDFEWFEATYWTANDGMVGLGDLPGGERFSIAYGASDGGAVIVGHATSAMGGEAFRWTKQDGMTALGHLPGGGSAVLTVADDVSADGSVVVGTDQIGLGVQAFRWTPDSGMQGLGYLPGGFPISLASAVSADGSIVVGNASSANGLEGWVWTEQAGMVGLGDFPGGPFQSFASDISGDGEVVVGRGYTDESEAAFVWDAQHGMRDLRLLLASWLGDQLDGWTLIEASSVSYDGQVIAGWGYNPGGRNEAWIAHIPEPAGLLSFSFILALPWTRWRPPAPARPQRPPTGT
jgi:probable HAF family extracellular repeat protein